MRYREIIQETTVEFSRSGGGARQVRFDQTTITYGVLRNTAEIILVSTPRQARRTGSARRAMQEFLRQADRADMTVYLSPEPMDDYPDVSKADLERFYHSLGFVANEDGADDHEMVRRPAYALHEGKTYAMTLRWAGASEDIQIFENPTVEQVKTLIQRSQESSEDLPSPSRSIYLRGITFEDKRMLLWNGYKATHDDILHEFYPDARSHHSEFTYFVVTTKFIDVLKQGDYDLTKSRYYANIQKARTLNESIAMTSDILSRDPSNHAASEFWENQSELLDNLVSLYKNDQPCPWVIVPAARIKAVWKSSAKTGFVRNAKALDAIAEQFRHNIMQLMVNNEISGHTEAQPKDFLEEYFEDDEIEAFVDWAIETETGGWRISDYGIDKLVSLAYLIRDCRTPEETLMVCDAILNVTHPRSDLASWFVEGGSRTMSELFEE